MIEFMKRICRSCKLFLVPAWGLAILITGTAPGGESKVIKDPSAHLNASLDGQALFRQHCAVCHGVDAKGGGPAARALRRPPTDLSLLSRMNGGKFPALAVQLAIKGASAIPEHGNSEMPMWGSVFNENGQNHELGDMRVKAVLRYIEHLQAK